MTGSEVKLTDWEENQLQWMAHTDVTGITAPASMRRLAARGLVICVGDPDDEISVWSITEHGRQSLNDHARRAVLARAEQKTQAA